MKSLILMEDNNKSKRVIEIPSQGSWVWKCDIRRVIGVTPNGWSEELKLIKKNNPEFITEYEPFKRFRKLPIPLARVIIEHVYCTMGEEIELKFTINSALT